MKPAMRRHLAIFEQATDAKDSHGGSYSEWTELCREFAEFVPLSGRERFLSAQMQTEVTARINIRYNSFGITTKMRVRIAGRVFGITHIRDDLARRELVIDLVEGLRDG